MWKKNALQSQRAFLTRKKNALQSKGRFFGLLFPPQWDFTCNFVFEGRFLTSKKPPFNLKGDFLVSFFPLYGILHVIFRLKGVFLAHFCMFRSNRSERSRRSEGSRHSRRSEGSHGFLSSPRALSTLSSP